MKDIIKVITITVISASLSISPGFGEDREWWVQIRNDAASSSSNMDANCSEYRCGFGTAVRVGGACCGLTWSYKSNGEISDVGLNAPEQVCLDVDAAGDANGTKV